MLGTLRLEDHKSKAPHCLCEHVGESGAFSSPFGAIKDGVKTEWQYGGTVKRPQTQNTYQL